MATPDNRLADQFARRLFYPCFALAHRLRWRGAERVPQSGPAIIAANHQSFYDPVLIGIAVPRRIVYMALARYFGGRVLGPLMQFCEALPVDESGSVPNAYRGMLKALRGRRLCGIFPEGRRTTDGRPRSPRPGVGALALATGAPVIPVSIRGAYHAWPPHRLLPRPGSIELLFGYPLHFPKDREASRDARRRRETARRIMNRIVEGLDPVRIL